MIQNRIYSYFERNPQLHVLFIFDKMGIIQTELEDVKDWSDGYVYKVFDGAWFNTKYAIENTWKDKRIVLLFPVGTYPHSEEQQLQFPLLDMLKANMEYKEDDGYTVIDLHYDDDVYYTQLDDKPINVKYKELTDIKHADIELKKDDTKQNI